MTNAAKFGEGYAIWLHLLLSTDRLAVTVASNGTDALVEQLADGRVGRAEQPLFAEGGRGLGVVLDLWDSLAVSSGRITIVRAERTLQHWRPGPGPLRIRFENFAFVRQ